MYKTSVVDFLHTSSWAYAFKLAMYWCRFHNVFKTFSYRHKEELFDGPVTLPSISTPVCAAKRTSTGKSLSCIA